MNTLAWLLLGHLVGDWVLQNDWMAKGKKTGILTLAGTIHFAIYAIVSVAALWLSGIRGRELTFYLIVGLIIFVSHWLIDAAGLAEQWMNLFRQTHLETVCIMVDQTFHLLVLAALTMVVRPGEG